MKVSLPPLYDHHNHLSLYAFLEKAISFNAFKTKDDFLNYLKTIKNDKLHVFTNYDNSKFELSLNDVEIDYEIVIINRSLHGFIFNKAAFEKVFTSSKVSFEQVNDKHWAEKNIEYIFGKLYDCSNLDQSNLLNVYNKFTDLGIAKSDDMAVSSAKVLAMYDEFNWIDKLTVWVPAKLFFKLETKEKETVTGIKIFTDGSIGMKTAAISKPYIGCHGGKLNYDDEALFLILKKSFSFNKEVAIHAIGDLAIAQVLRILNTFEPKKIKEKKIRIEHAQFISKEQAIEAKNLDITLSMQPNFSQDSIDYTDRLPIHLIKRNNPFRMLIDEVGFTAGANLIFGSDGMPSGLEQALYSSLFPPLESQKILLEEFIEGYCIQDVSNDKQILFEIDFEKKKIEKT
ncbi:MAG: amidohydrolase family protein [Pseudomonadota bacterium]